MSPEPQGALTLAVAKAKAGDPLAPVTVVAPSGFAAVSARRWSVLGTQGEPGNALANVDFTTMGGLVRRLGAPVLGRRGLRPVPAAVDLETIRVVSADADQATRRLGSHPRALSALQRSFSELRRWTEPGIEALARQPTRAGAVAQLLLGVRRRLHEHGFADSLDLRHAALEGVPALGSELGPVLVMRPTAMAPVEETLLDMLGSTFGVRQLGAPPALPCSEVRPCADPEAEALQAVAEVLRALEDGVPLWRQALVHPSGYGYARLLHQQLAAAGIAANGPETRRLDRCTAGRVLLGLLELAGGDLRRHDLMAWLASGPIVTGPGGRPVPASRWNAISAEAGVVRGLPQWRERLTRLAERRPTDRHEAAALQGFVEELASATSVAVRTWSGATQWCQGLLDRYLDQAWGPWPDVQLSALAQVRDTVATLADLDTVSAGTDLATFRRTVRSHLEGQFLEETGAFGAFGHGVFVAPFDQARCLQFHTLIVTGLADGLVPGVMGDDALLPDEARRLDTSGALRSRAVRLDELLADITAAVATGEQRRLITYPRVDPRSGRAQDPSRWIERLSGPHTAWRPVDSFAASLGVQRPATTPVDLALRNLDSWTSGGGDATQAPPALADERLQRAMDAIRSRASRSFTRFDGSVGAGLVTPFDPARPVSATRLETYAECPRRFLFDRVLGVSERTLPEDLWRIEARDRGSLVHAILERYVLERIDGAPRSLDRLLAIADDALDQATAGGLVGKALLWRLDQAAIRRDLRMFHAEEGDLVPLAAEFGFGMDDDAAPPVAVALADGKVMRFRGHADRVDRNSAGELVVSDYKTGRQTGLSRLTADPLVGGRRLQLPLYAMAARSAFGGGTVHARYWMVSAERATACYHLELTDAVESHFRQVVGQIAVGVEAGLFPGIPGPPRDNCFDSCMWCDFDRVCPAVRDRQWATKRASPELDPVNDLVESEAPADVARAVTRLRVLPDGGG